MKITLDEVQNNVDKLANRSKYDKEFIFELLTAYGRSASAITKLRNGDLNLAEDKENEVLQRGVIYFKHVKSGKLLASIDSLDQDPLVVRYNPRYLIVTDYEQVVAKDTKKSTTLDIELKNIGKHADFFFGWTGDEVTSEKTEAQADRRAADKMKELYQEIELINADRLSKKDSNFRHHMNVFFSRLLFCFFAEDTKIFSRDNPNLFTSSIQDYTSKDGSDLDSFLERLFNSLDSSDKVGLNSPFTKFPYVNGTIFDTKKHDIAIPKFNQQARNLILDCGGQDWSQINPDIFGSMFQSIVDPKHRASNGMHYTSVPNIIKTIEPLFLDSLREDFDKNFDNHRKLFMLWDRISKIKIFDPACGSGNFLIIAYKELRKIEHAIIDRLFSEDYKRAALSGKLESKIKLDNFYGIEIDDFAHEVAILSLYLTKHQMNVEFEEHFGKEISLIPLKDNANIVRGNAAWIDWSDVCPNEPHIQGLNRKNSQETLLEFDDGQPELEFGQELWDEIYLIGNPPFGGSRKQSRKQKDDLKTVFDGVSSRYRSMDYVSIWFYKATQWLGENKIAALSLVSTNSIVQGLQVGLVWPLLLKDSLKIDYAVTSFKWENSAAGNAGITCVIIALSKRRMDHKYIFSNGIKLKVNSINPYLVAGESDLIVLEEETPISNISEMNFGNMPADGGQLMITEEEAEKLIKRYHEVERHLFKLIGAKELIQSKSPRYCLWLSNNPDNRIFQIPLIKERLQKVKKIRGLSSRPELAETPHLFAQITADPSKYSSALFLPRVSSENYVYVPMRFSMLKELASDACQVIPDAPIWLFAILTSRIHTIWLDSVGGKMKTDHRYSKKLVYNTFPIPVLNDFEKNELASSAKAILFAREEHSEKPLSDLYHKDRMPDGIKSVHIKNDILVDSLYRKKPYSSDEERLADLFALYEKMIAEEKENQK